ncbi:hypothetical protein [Actinoallomurus sp. CA-142502]|uniref:hypothetical protein n=1 Tax=Actinoallomurus sp. CA-142502 TaxID=3239885 RepID=UPI003D901DFE
MDDHQRRHALCVIRMIKAYGLIAKMLMGLPLRIQLPEVGDSIYADEIRKGLVRAYALLKDIPMDADIAWQLGLMIIDWVTACEWLFADDEDAEPWLLDAVEIQIGRIVAGADVVNERLARDIDPE